MRRITAHSQELVGRVIKVRLIRGIDENIVIWLLIRKIYLIEWVCLEIIDLRFIFTLRRVWLIRHAFSSFNFSWNDSFPTLRLIEIK